MSDESTNYIETGIDPAQRTAPPPRLHHFDPPAAPLKRMLGSIPPRAEEAQDDPSAAIGAHAASEALKRSEARRDAVLAVALAIKRRGDNPVTDWSTKDVETSYAIADQLIALG